MEFVANGDAFLGGQIGAMQCVLYHLVAPAGIGVFRTPISCPNTDRLGLKSNSGGQHRGEMQSIGWTRPSQRTLTGLERDPPDLRCHEKEKCRLILRAHLCRMRCAKFLGRFQREGSLLGAEFLNDGIPVHDPHTEIAGAPIAACEIESHSTIAPL